MSCQLKYFLYLFTSVSVQLWRKALLLKYIRLPIPLKINKKSTFNFSQTVDEMVFVGFEVENMRMFLV